MEENRGIKKMKRLFLVLFLMCTLAVHAQLKVTSGNNWVGTWTTAQQIPVKAYMPNNNNMTNRSVRQIVKVSIGGQIIRLKFSNEMSSEPVIIRSVYVATSLDSFAVNPKSARYLKFDNKYKVVIPAGKVITSDALNFSLKPLQKLAITINYTKAPMKPTVHMGSRTTSYIMKGVTNAKSNFKYSFRENHWFNIDAIEVYDMGSNAIAIIGNSITDGKNSTDNAQNRWPDILSETLQKKMNITNKGILNLGIGNNRVVLAGGFGLPAKDRFNRDILEQRGVGTVVIFEGVNDIGGSRGNSETVARQIIEAYQEMIKKSRAHRMKVYIGTITPFMGAGYYSPFHEAARETINEWIRTHKELVDGVLDFDELLRDPEEHHRMKKNLQSDWLHPNPEGYRLMGEYAAGILK